MTAAFETLSPTRDTPVLFIGDHASKVIAPRYDNLGLSGDDLTRHIAWDIGTEKVIRALCTRFGAAGHICGFSRLVIDVNRDPNAAGLIPESSDGTLIPANKNLPQMERALRMAEFYTPYHGGLAKAVQDLRRQHKDPLIVSVHSFTPRPLTATDDTPPRDMDIALLVKGDMQTADKFMTGLKEHFPHFEGRINEPYSAYDLNYTIDVHARLSGDSWSRHLAIEIRQDHIGSETDAARVAQGLGDVLSDLI
jgi:predicted N-formylglutamate amidohydrolase